MMKKGSRRTLSNEETERKILFHKCTEEDTDDNEVIKVSIKNLKVHRARKVTK